MLRRIDPLGPLLAVLGFGVVLLRGFNGTLLRDLALYAYSAQQFADGVPPYVGVLNRAGPLAHIVPGIGATIAGWLGTDDILTMRVLSSILAMLAVWVIYVVGRDLYASKAAGLFAAATLLTLRVFMTFANAGTREKLTMVCLVTFALWAILNRRWAWAGAFVSLATLTWQPAFFVGAATALAAMAGFRGRELVRALVRFCVGGAIPAGLTVIAFTSVGALRPFLDGFVLINLHYTDQTGLMRFLTHKSDLLHGGYKWSLWVFLIGLIAAAVTAALQWFRADERDDPRIRAQIGLGVGVLTAVLWSMRAFNGWPDSLFAAPFAALGFAGLLHWLVARTPRPKVLAVGLAAVALVLAGLSAAHDGEGDSLGRQRQAVAAAFDVVGQDATIASIGAPAPLVLAHKTNPVRYQMFTGGFDRYVDDTYPGGLKGLARHLDRVHPTFMVVDSGARYLWVKPTLRRDYELVGSTADVNWWARKDLDPQELQQLRAALG